MTHCLSLNFFGQYRPAHFEAESFYDAAEAFSEAVIACRRDDRNKLYGWLLAVEQRQREGSASCAIEHGPLALTWRPSAHDPFLDRVCASFPPFPGLNYALAVQTEKES